MERTPVIKRKAVDIERDFVDSRLGPARLIRAYERLVPIDRRRLMQRPSGFKPGAHIHHASAQGA